jgi:hypothetical protein
MDTPAVAEAPRLRISPLSPAYFLGRPAYVWVDALRPRRLPAPAPSSAGRPKAAAA